MIWLALLSAWARPTDGGLYAYDAEDVVVSLDDSTERVRVHYSEEGPNQADDYDRDEDGVWDFPERVAETAAEVLLYYGETGFSTPLDELALGDEILGGSLAFDFYLVDFGGDADGNFGTDTCGRDDAGDYVCSGYMNMENDFAGYGYASDAEAITVLTSHELFHAVQAAYEGSLETWFSEGTAVWAEHHFDPGIEDFLWFAQAYLDDSGRTLDRPPTGPVPSFAYGTALWFDFLALRHGDEVMVELLEGTRRQGGNAVELVPMMETLIEAQGDTLKQAWVDFATANLATGSRAGLLESYDYAAELDGVPLEDKGKTIDVDHRFYPLAASYFRYNHQEDGPIWLAVDEAAPDLWVAVHPVVGDDKDGPVDDAVDGFFVEEAGAVAVAGGEDLPAGYYLVVGTHAAYADNSVKRRLCVGDEAHAMACLPEDTADTADILDTADDEPAPCGCASGAPGSLVWLPFGLLWCRRRQKVP